MPCYMTGSAVGDARLAASEARQEAQEVTRHLCAVCELLEQSGVALPVSVAPWWERHKQIDAKRKREAEEVRKRAKKRRSALGKLTPEERVALGLADG